MVDKKSRNLSKKTLILIGVVVVILFIIIIISKIISVNADLVSSSGQTLEQEYEQDFGSPPPNIQGACVVQHVMCYGSGAVTDIPCGDSVCSPDGCPPDSPAYQQSCLGSGQGSGGSGQGSNPSSSESSENQGTATTPSPFEVSISHMTLAPTFSLPGFVVQEGDTLPVGIDESGDWTDLSGIGITLGAPDLWPPPNPPNNITNLTVQYVYSAPYHPPLCSTSADCPQVSGGSYCIKSISNVGVCTAKYQYSNCTDPSRICIITPYQNAVLSVANASDPTTMLQIETWTGAQCRYSVNADTTFSNGQPFLEDNGTDSIQHTIPLNYVGTNSVVHPGIYSIYERCIDSTGNESSKVQMFIVTSSGLSARILGIRGAEAATFLVSTNSTGAEQIIIPNSISFTAAETPPSGNQNLVLVIEKDAVPISTIPMQASVSITSPEASSSSTVYGVVGIIFGLVFIVIIVGIILSVRKRILNAKQASVLNQSKTRKSSGFKKKI